MVNYPSTFPEIKLKQTFVRYQHLTNSTNLKYTIDSSGP